jgi:hypothetical protein
MEYTALEVRLPREIFPALVFGRLHGPMRMETCGFSAAMVLQEEPGETSAICGCTCLSSLHENIRLCSAPSALHLAHFLRCNSCPSWIMTCARSTFLKVGMGCILCLFPFRENSEFLRIHWDKFTTNKSPSGLNFLGNGRSKLYKLDTYVIR